MKKKRKLKKSVKRLLFTLIFIIILFLGLEIVNYYVILNKKLTPVFLNDKDYYTNSSFGIITLKSKYDFDNDGVDDYTDILMGAKKYAKFNPKYVSKYYAGGYPVVEEEGVSTDLIWYSLKEAGYLLKDMIIEDIKIDQTSGNIRYNLIDRDDNIDFRRVGVQKTFFEQYLDSLTTDLDYLDEFQPGDIILFDDSDHIAIISDKRSSSGIPYLIHNYSDSQKEKEEDVLDSIDMTITGHYRFTYNNEIKHLINRIKN